MAAVALEWSGPSGGKIGVGFDDGHFGLQEMSIEIDLVGQAYPNFPDEVPPGTRFVFAMDVTGHLTARFKVGTTVYRSGGQRTLHWLWETVGLIDRLVHPERLKIAS